jgi:hypothetical protein
MTADDSGSAAQLASLTESAAETLNRLVSTVPIGSEDSAGLHALGAATMVRNLEVALDHIAQTISAPAVKDALPNAASHLDMIAARIGSAAHLIRSAEPAITAGRRAGHPAGLGPPVAAPPAMGSATGAVGGVTGWKPVGDAAVRVSFPGNVTLTAPVQGGVAGWRPVGGGPVSSARPRPVR